MILSRRLVAVAVAMGAMALGGSRAEATFLLGTTVTSPGVVLVTGLPLPYASLRTSAVISDPGVEFTFKDGLNTDTFDFSDRGLTVTDNSATVLGAAPFSAKFTDAAFLDAGVLGPSSGFLGLTASISGATLTVTSTRSAIGPQVRTASFRFFPAASVTVTSTPEPSTLAGLGAGAVALVAARLARRRRC